MGSLLLVSAFAEDSDEPAWETRADGRIIQVTSRLLECSGAVALLLFFARGRGMIVVDWWW